MARVEEGQELDSKRGARPTAPLRILHVTSGLGPGGAETVLYRLITNSSHIEHEVICLAPRDRYSDLLERHGVRVHHVEFYSTSSAAHGFLPLYRRIGSSRADVVQCWMYRGNAVGGLIARTAGKPVVWNVRASTLGPLRFASRALARITGKLTRFVPRYVINCSEKSAELHASWGYSAVEGSVVPNGYDSTVFFPDDEARSATRRALRVEPGEFLIGTVGRWHAQKGYPGLIEALRLLRERKIPFRMVMVGRDLDEQNGELSQLLEKSGLTQSVQLFGERSDIPDLARAPDLHVLASIGAEGFPNVVAETMLSGTPNVVTDVGDSSLIVGETGWVVPPGNPERFADAIAEAYSEWKNAQGDWAARRAAARARIAENYSIERMVAAYENVWRHVASKG